MKRLELKLEWAIFSEFEVYFCFINVIFVATLAYPRQKSD